MDTCNIPNSYISNSTASIKNLQESPSTLILLKPSSLLNSTVTVQFDEITQGRDIAKMPENR